jgi:hypothetical protein
MSAASSVLLLAILGTAPSGEFLLAPSLARAVERAESELASRLAACEGLSRRSAAVLVGGGDVPLEVIDGLKARLFARDFEVSVGSAPDSADLVVEVGVATDGEGGVLRLRCLRPALPAIAVRYEGKDWVDRPESSRWSTAGTRPIAGRSSIEGAPADAESAAFADALATLRREAAIRAEIDPSADAAVVERVIPGPIIRGKFLRDTFVEMEDKPYGSIYRGHVLLAVPEKAIEQFARAIRDLIVRDRWTWALRGGLLLVLAGVVFAGYVLADGWLRGTHTRALKLVCAALLAASSIALIGVHL